jgi:hypothetical protein
MKKISLGVSPKHYLEKSMADPDMIPKMMPSDDLINDELMNHFGGKELE